MSQSGVWPDRLVEVAGKQLTATLTRAVDLEGLLKLRSKKHLDITPLFAKGPALNGARFTPPTHLIDDEIESLYFAEDAATAFAEANQVSALVEQLQPHLATPSNPKVLFSAEVQLMSLLDLADRRVQEVLIVSTVELLAPWRIANSRGSLSATQKIGLAAFESNRFDGIRYPSAKNPSSAC